MDKYDSLFSTISDLVLCHSPSGVEGEVDENLSARFKALGIESHLDAAGNLIAKIAGSGGGKLAITAHKDEIGTIVTKVEDGGVIRVRKLGGTFPWIYGEGVVDILGSNQTLQGILSFGSRHVSHASPQSVFKETTPVKWADAWIETKRTAAELADAGVRPGTRVVVGKHRKAPFRIKDHICSYALDNKASLAILLDIARRVENPVPDIYLVATSREEVGAQGALYLTQNEKFDAMIALEIAPVASEYDIKYGEIPVLMAEDHFGLYDDGLLCAIEDIARSANVPTQAAVLNNFGSDGSIASQHGHVPRAACVAFPTQNTHGYEIAHLGAIQNCTELVTAVCDRPIVGAG